MTREGIPWNNNHAGSPVGPVYGPRVLLGGCGVRLVLSTGSVSGLWGTVQGVTGVDMMVIGGGRLVSRPGSWEILTGMITHCKAGWVLG